MDEVFYIKLWFNFYTNKIGERDGCSESRKI